MPPTLNPGIVLVGVVAFVLANVWSVANNLEFYFIIDTNPVPLVVSYALHIIAGLFLIAGLTAIHNAQKPYLGVFGRVAYWICVAGFASFAIVVWPVDVIGWLVIHIGAVLYGIATMSAGVLSERAAWLLAVGPLGGLIGGSIVEVYAIGDAQGWGPYVGVLAIGGGFLGLWLSTATARPAPAGSLAGSPAGSVEERPPEEAEVAAEPAASDDDPSGPPPGEPAPPPTDEERQSEP